jgi:hypothetical protein
MSCCKSAWTALSLALAAAFFAAPARAQSPTASASTAERTLAAAEEEAKTTFLIFHKDEGPATRAMAQIVSRGVEARAEKTTFAYARIGDPADKRVIERFDVARAPMPLVVAVAPNGAITGVYSKQITDRQMDEAIVTPTMARCLKAMQDGKLVLVCIHASSRNVLPVGVKNFQLDPHFQKRTVVEWLSATDPDEGPFFEQLELDPATIQGTMTALLAPPGVIVGKFASTATKDQMAAALHKAGKCCDDPHCKHNHGGQATAPRTKN